MSSAPMIRPKMRVAVIDDDPSSATSTRVEVEDAGFEPIVIGGEFADIKQLLSSIATKKAEAAICDHRLSPGKLAQFTGAFAVAELVKRKVPAILVTSFKKRDIQTTIRMWRREIPVLLDKDAIDPETIKNGLIACATEIAGHPSSSRIPRRTILRVASSESGIVDVFVPAWNPDESIPIPLNLFPDALQHSVSPGQCYFVKVNIGAENSDELFFMDFQVAPEPDEEDKLG